MLIVDSRILASGERRAMGLYEVWRLGSLLGFRIGIILADFHGEGIMLEFMILLKRFVMIDME